MFSLLPNTVHAIQALACLSDPDGDWVLAKDVAESSGLSEPQIQKMLHALRRLGLVEAKRSAFVPVAHELLVAKPRTEATTSNRAINSLEDA